MRWIAFFAAFGALPCAAHAVTLDFTGDICGGGAACTPSAAIDQSYGDLPGLDVIYDGSDAPGLQPMYWYPDNYSGLTGVAYGHEISTPSQITLDPSPGYIVTLNSFQLGAWDSRPQTTRVRVYDLGGGADFVPETGNYQISTLPDLFRGPFESENGIVIDFGPDAWNVAIDNIDLTLARTPLPPSLSLLGLAFLGLGLRRRASRRR